MKQKTFYSGNVQGDPTSNGFQGHALKQLCRDGGCAHIKYVTDLFTHCDVWGCITIQVASASWPPFLDFQRTVDIKSCLLD